MHKDDFAKAYFYNVEPEYESLSFLFGLDDINLSDLPGASSDDEDVTSPIPKSPIPKMVCRKLFDEDEGAEDEHSTTNVSRDKRFPQRNAFPSRFVDSNSQDTKNASSSSCASSSPSAWWKKSFK